MSKATLTLDASLVDEDAGIFLLIPQDELAAFLRHPVTSTIYLRDWCLPFFQDHSVEECLALVSNLGALDESLLRDTEWLASRLSE